MLDSQGPVLVSEPRSSVEFSNDTGAMIHCSAHGSPSPRIDWLMGDGSPVLPIPNIREMLVNGSRYFLPFGAESYRHDVHSAVYRCQASNSVGKVLGREITVKAGKRESVSFIFRRLSRSCLTIFLGLSLSSSRLILHRPLMPAHCTYSSEKRRGRLSRDSVVTCNFTNFTCDLEFPLKSKIANFDYRVYKRCFW